MDYLFCQVWVDKAEVSTTQNYGNILAGVASVRHRAGARARAGRRDARADLHGQLRARPSWPRIQTPGGRPRYDGDAHLDGVPGTAAPIALSFAGTAGSTCGALLPTGHTTDVFDGVTVTCLDNGMPIVVMRADALGRTGYESREALDADAELKTRLESIRLQAGPAMRLGDVTNQTVPKMILVAPPRSGASSRRGRSSRIAVTRRLACSRP